LPDRKRIREFDFPDTRLKFPVPFGREFTEIGQQGRGLLNQMDRSQHPECAKFPVFSLTIQGIRLQRAVRSRLRPPAGSPCCSRFFSQTVRNPAHLARRLQQILPASWARNYFCARGPGPARRVYSILREVSPTDIDAERFILYARDTTTTTTIKPDPEVAGEGDNKIGRAPSRTMARATEAAAWVRSDPRRVAPLARNFIIHKRAR
jgi:hypothetical protein